MEECLEVTEELADFGEGISDLAEGSEEIEPFIEDAKIAVEDLSSNQSLLEDCLSSVKTGIKNLVEFVGKNVAIGIILWGVNATLSKLISGHEKGDKHMHDLIKAMIVVVTTETKMSTAIANWLKDHDGDMVELDGLEIPLESIIYKYMQPVSHAVDQALSVAKSFKEKAEGSVKYKVPNLGDMQKFLVAADDFLNALNLLVAFISKNVQKFHGLSSFPVKNDDIDTLTTQIETVKAQLI